MEVLIWQRQWKLHLPVLKERIKTLSDEVSHVHEEVSELKAQANRWKGAFWVMLGIGGIFGSVGHLFVGWMR